MEVTFQEVRADVGFTAPHDGSAKSPGVPGRIAPCLLGLFSPVSLIFARQVRDQSVRLLHALSYAKEEVTLSDVVTTMRRLCWEAVLKHSWEHRGVAKLPNRLRRTLLDHLSHAA